MAEELLEFSKVFTKKIHNVFLYVLPKKFLEELSEVILEIILKKIRSEFAYEFLKKNKIFLGISQENPYGNSHLEIILETFPEFLSV